MTLLISDSDVRGIFTMPVALSAMEECIVAVSQGKALQIPRIQIDTEKGWLRIQPGLIQSRGYMGFKAYTITKGHGPRYAVFLYSTETGELVAVIDADSLTSIRTGAMTGLATKLLANPAAEVVGVLGSGHQARTALEAIATTKNVKRARIYSPNEGHRRHLADTAARELKVQAEAVAEPISALRGCDIIVTATSNWTMDPIVKGEWIDKGTHFNAIGAVGRGRVEIDNDLFSKSSLVVVDSVEEIMDSSEEVILAIASGVIRKEDLVPLSAVYQGRKKRTSTKDVTLFKSQGSGAQDLFAAAKIFEVASAKGAGKEIAEIAPPLRKQAGK